MKVPVDVEGDEGAVPVLNGAVPGGEYPDGAVGPVLYIPLLESRELVKGLEDDDGAVPGIGGPCCLGGELLLELDGAVPEGAVPEGEVPDGAVLLVDV